MVRITLALIRKRAEHNNGEVSSLEEISLHQQEIEKIEVLDQCCRELKILYLQNNVINRIENLGRLKELQYVNLALNNVTVIENLEGCEALRKLDLTVNFVGDLRSISALQKNRELRELYLTGNPCTQYPGYRAYVVHLLPQLEKFDGVAVTRSERIQAAQEYERVKDDIERLSAEYAEERKKAAATTSPTLPELPDDVDLDEEEKRYWQEHTDFTPEARLEAQRRYAAIRQRKEQAKNPPVEKAKRTYVRDGRALNVNEGDWAFVLEGQEASEQNFVLDLACYRYLDTSQIELDVHPTHVRVVMKGKVFQLVLPEEVKSDSELCRAERSQTTGHLRITMPKARPVLQTKKAAKHEADAAKKAAKSSEPGQRELLDVKETPKGIDLANIVGAKKSSAGAAVRTVAEPRGNDAGFVDDDEVPPLE